MATSKEKKEEKKIEKIKNPGKVNQDKARKKLIIAIVLVILVILVLFFSIIFAMIQKSKITIVKGVSTKGIELSNLTATEAKNKIIEEINKETKTPIKLKYNDYNLDLNLSEIEFNYKVDDTVKEAYEIGRSDDIIKSNFSILSTIVKGKEIKLKYTYNEDALKKIIENINSSIPGKVSEYTYCIEGEELIITSGVDGVKVKSKELENLIINSIINRDSSIEKKEYQELTIPIENKIADKIDIDKIYSEIYCEPKDAYLIEEPFQLIKDEDGVDFAISKDEAKALITGDKSEYSIPLKITKANKTVSNLGAKVFPHTLSEYKTDYNAGYLARAKNLEIAGEKINGTVLMPGEEFSFNQVVGKRTVEEGYQNAPVYENGKVVDGIAGGICQISSTLYNAVLLANLEVTVRRNHNYISTYVPEGRDATVVYGSQDFKFKNSRQYPIQINCTVAGGIARCEIKGIKEDTEYDVRIITNVTATIPFSEEIEEDSSVAPGTKQVVQAGHNGAKVTSYRVLFLNGEEVSRTLLYNDTYKVMNKIVKVSPGTTKKQEQKQTNIPEDLPQAEEKNNIEQTAPTSGEPANTVDEYIQNTDNTVIESTESASQPNTNTESVSETVEQSSGVSDNSLNQILEPTENQNLSTNVIDESIGNTNINANENNI